MISGKHVLIVEDEGLIALDIEAELESRGWQIVGSVGTVAQAMEILSTTDISVAVLDVNLGATDSFKLAATLIERNIPVVFLSGVAGSSLPNDLKDNPILSKPIEYGKLQDVLERLVS